MQVKTFTYKKKLGTFYLEKMFSNTKMDDHIAQMLQEGWEVLSTGSHKGPSKGIGLPGDTMTVTFKKD